MSGVLCCLAQSVRACVCGGVGVACKRLREIEGAQLPFRIIRCRMCLSVCPPLPVTETAGVTITVTTQYQPTYSSEKLQEVHAYRIRIVNERAAVASPCVWDGACVSHSGCPSCAGETAVRLLSRHWYFEDGTGGPIIEASGEGVVGQQPHFRPGVCVCVYVCVAVDAPPPLAHAATPSFLLAGTCFEYYSGTSITSNHGYMYGELTFRSRTCPSPACRAFSVWLTCACACPCPPLQPTQQPSPQEWTGPSWRLRLHPDDPRHCLSLARRLKYIVCVWSGGEGRYAFAAPARTLVNLRGNWGRRDTVVARDWMEADTRFSSFTLFGSISVSIGVLTAATEPARVSLRSRKGISAGVGPTPAHTREHPGERGACRFQRAQRENEKRGGARTLQQRLGVQEGLEHGLGQGDARPVCLRHLQPNRTI